MLLEISLRLLWISVFFATLAATLFVARYTFNEMSSNRQEADTSITLWVAHKVSCVSLFFFSFSIVIFAIDHRFIGLLIAVPSIMIALKTESMIAWTTASLSVVSTLCHLMYIAALHCVVWHIP